MPQSNTVRRQRTLDKGLQKAQNENRELRRDKDALQRELDVSRRRISQLEQNIEERNDGRYTPALQSELSDDISEYSGGLSDFFQSVLRDKPDGISIIAYLKHTNQIRGTNSQIAAIASCKPLDPIAFDDAVNRCIADIDNGVPTLEETMIHLPHDAPEYMNSQVRIAWNAVRRIYISAKTGKAHQKREVFGYSDKRLILLASLESPSASQIWRDLNELKMPMIKEGPESASLSEPESSVAAESREDEDVPEPMAGSDEANTDMDNEADESASSHIGKEIVVRDRCTGGSNDASMADDTASITSNITSASKQSQLLHATQGSNARTELEEMIEELEKESEEAFVSRALELIMDRFRATEGINVAQECAMPWSRRAALAIWRNVTVSPTTTVTENHPIVQECRQILVNELIVDDVQGDAGKIHTARGLALDVCGYLQHFKELARTSYTI